VLTDWAEIAAQVRQDTVTLELPPVAEPTRRALESGDRCWQGSEIVVGVPHLVLPVSNLDDLAIDTVAPPLRSHPALGPEGANVHFVERESAVLRIRSFERGVEAETLCCGSGVVAAGLLALMDSDATRISVQARSGDRLTVETLGAPPVAPSRLTGPVRLVAEIDPLD
jgi:diaminopimelate epimerase